MATDFLGKLRMANIFPVGGQGGTPFGMPDLDSGSGDIDPNQIFNMIHRSRDKDQERALNLDNEMRARARQEAQYGKPLMGSGQSNLANIAQSSMDPNAGKRVVFGGDSSITPYQKESLAIQRDRLKQTGTLGEERIETTRRGQDISQQRADVYKFKAENPNLRIITPPGGNVMAINPVTGEAIDLGIDSGRLTEAERIELQGEQAMDRVNAVTDRQRELTDTRGNQRLGEIAARAGEQRITNRDKTGTPTKADQQIIAQEMINTNPNLAKYIKLSPDGLVEIDKNAPLDVVSTINQRLNPKKDISLPSSSSSSKPVASTTPTKPTAADLLKKYGG